MNKDERSVRRLPLDAVLALVALTSVLAVLAIALGISLTKHHGSATSMPSTIASGPEVTPLLAAVDRLVGEIDADAPQVQAFKAISRLALGSPDPAWNYGMHPDDLMWVVHVSGGRYHPRGNKEYVSHDLTLVFDAKSWHLNSLSFTSPSPRVASGPFETFRNR